MADAIATVIYPRHRVLENVRRHSPMGCSSVIHSDSTLGNMSVEFNLLRAHHCLPTCKLRQSKKEVTENEMRVTTANMGVMSEEIP